MAQNGIAISQPPNFMSQTPSSNFPQFNPVNHAGRMSGPLMEGNDPMLGGNFGQAAETPSQFQSTPTQQTSPVQTIPGSMDQPPTIETSGGGSYDQGFIDPNDPSLFNFDISGLNFGNHYGALEFGMLGHMSGAVGTPDVDLNSMGGQSHHGSLSYDNTSGYNPGNSNFNFNQFPGWQGLTRQTSNNNVWTASTNGMDAFAIGEASIMGQSPASQSQDFNSNYQSGGTMSPENQFAQIDQNQNHSNELLRQSFAQPAPQQPQRKQVPPYNGGNNQRKRRRDISEIYTSVTAPYPYTQGFHALTAFLQKRFPSKKTLRIAKALASIRPSFISCNKNLGHEDLIFMEKCFQRTLCEYEDFVNHYGTPTIICRRTGEIASVSKEFSLVTGWRRDVLLGKEPNLNVNTGSNNSGTQTGTSSRGAVTPRAPNVDIDPGRPQPVFLAELMDEDSVCQFYEDFAELAFGASRASIIGPTVSLLKYKTKDDAGWGANDFNDDGRRPKRSSSGEVKMETLMKGEAGTKALGDRDGRVDCSMCWTVKRDTFDIPVRSSTYPIHDRTFTDLLIDVDRDECKAHQLLSLHSLNYNSSSFTDTPPSFYQSSEAPRFFIPFPVSVQWHYACSRRVGGHFATPAGTVCGLALCLYLGCACCAVALKILCPWDRIVHFSLCIYDNYE